MKCSEMLDTLYSSRLSKLQNVHTKHILNKYEKRNFIFRFGDFQKYLN